jgi:nitroimidazol reductase NimA-like FMN-containing flavoprotein (pyridoxamine 5'-phosphate oxidase superfamily)
MSSVPDEAATLVDGATVMAHLATAVDDRPHVAPVWYRYEDGVVEILTTGRKLANIQQNPRVALSFQHDIDGTTKWTVTMLGTATVIDDEAETRAATAAINDKYDAPPDAHPENVLVRIEVGTAAYRTYD